MHVHKTILPFGPFGPKWQDTGKNLGDMWAGTKRGVLVDVEIGIKSLKGFKKKRGEESEREEGAVEPKAIES